jgi:hypothetical protein
MPKAIILGSGIDSLSVARTASDRGIHAIILEPTGRLDGEQHPILRNRPMAQLIFAAEIYFHQMVRSVFFVRDEICSLHVINSITGEMSLFPGDFFYFPGPLHTLVTAMSHVSGHRFLPERNFSNLSVGLDTWEQLPRDLSRLIAAASD